MRTLIRNLFVLILLLAVVGGVYWWGWGRNGKPAAAFRTMPVHRGELLATISATGTVEPEEVVDVGAQVAGQILSFGTDPADKNKVVDYGTHVDVDTVLARIDDSVYTADVDSFRAALEAADASVMRAQADLGQMKAKAYQAQRDWERAQKIGASDALSQNDYDMYQANYETARANVGVGEAAVVQAQKSVEQAKAAMVKVKRNLDYCIIKSPVKGVVIDRRVNIGQTVVSSLNAPSLFLIAKDLTRMQVWASVNEADIGSIREGQPVTFTVDAFPGRTFKGTVGKVRLNATMTQNVVTYTVEVITDNSDGKLLPYLTATLRFEVAKHDNALLVPNVALRWVPPSPEQIAPEARDSMNTGRGGRGADGSGAGGGGAAGGGGPRPGGPGASEGQPANGAKRDRTGGGGAAPNQHRGTVWVQDGEYVKPIRVKTGNTDGTNTEVVSDELPDATEVIVGVRSETAAADDAKNPFMPQFGRRR